MATVTLLPPVVTQTAEPQRVLPAAAAQPKPAAPAAAPDRFVARVAAPLAVAEPLALPPLGAATMKGYGVAYADALPENTTGLSVRFRGDDVTPTGLTYYALTIWFPNGSWAHGGLQGHEGRPGANWGGLATHGGGRKDYENENPAADLELIQNARDPERSAQTLWKQGVEYVYSIERGEPVQFAPGHYDLIADRGADVEHPRTMWQWHFSVRPADGGEPIYSATLFDGADHIAKAAVFAENGPGTDPARMSAQWSELVAAPFPGDPIAVGYSKPLGAGTTLAQR